MKKILLLIILLFSIINIYSQKITINYQSAKLQYDDYIKYYTKIIKDNFETIYNDHISCQKNVTKIDSLFQLKEIDMEKLSIILIPSVGTHVIEKRVDTLYCALIFNYNLLPKNVLIFYNNKIFALMERTRLDYEITYLNFAINQKIVYDCIEPDIKDKVYVNICSINDNFIITKTEIKFLYSFCNLDENKINNNKYFYHQLYNYLLKNPYYIECNQNGDFIFEKIDFGPMN